MLKKNTLHDRTNYTANSAAKDAKYTCPKPVPQITEKNHRLARAVPINPLEYAGPTVHTEFAGQVVWVAVVHTVVYAVTLLAQTVTV
jgi:hypothetical protein